MTRSVPPVWEDPMTTRAQTLPLPSYKDPWTALFELPETDYLDPELLDRFLDHPDPNPARDWLLTSTH